MVGAVDPQKKNVCMNPQQNILSYRANQVDGILSCNALLG
jgi:hypothetical protein